ncbi:MAG: hypothetical protein K1X83_14760 [Oligoflexia bacterium]|nr:hypothetical protein [Oligoflexia bacterium]
MKQRMWDLDPGSISIGSVLDGFGLENASAAVSLDEQGPDSLYLRLSGQGLNNDLIEQIFQGVMNSKAPNVPLEIRLARELARLFKFETRIPHKTQFVAFFGALGSGKTTALAKLAASTRFSTGLRIGLISLAAEGSLKGVELKTFAPLLGFPLLELGVNEADPESIDRALACFSSLDLVLIDTPALDHDQFGVRRLIKYEFPEIESVYVMAAHKGLKKSVRRSFSDERVVITGLDRSARIGEVLNQIHAGSNPLAFFSTGRRVPHDLEPANAQRLAKILLRTLH